MNHRRTIGILILAVLFWGTTAAGAAEKEPPDTEDLPWDRGYVQLGVFATALKSGFRLGVSNVGLGIDLSVEDFLGLESNTTAFRVDGGWRLTRNLRHGLTFSWFNLNRSGTNKLTSDIELPDGETLPSGFEISSIFNVDIIKVRYEYSALLDKRVDLKVGGGLYVMPIKFGLGEVGEERTEESITAPLPVVSVSFNFVLSPRWRLRQNLDFLFLKISNFEGGIVDLNVVAEVALAKRFAIGFGVESLNIGLTVDSDSAYPGVDFVGSVGFAYTGGVFYLRGKF